MTLTTKERHALLDLCMMRLALDDAGDTTSAKRQQVEADIAALTDKRDRS
jgi:hypothetical protein